MLGTPPIAGSHQPQELYHRCHTWGTSTCPGSNFYPMSLPSSQERPPGSAFCRDPSRAPCLLRPEKSSLPSQPLAAPQASVAMATEERLAPMKAAGRKDGEALQSRCSTIPAHGEVAGDLTCPPGFFSPAALPTRAWARKGQRCPVLPSLRCHSGCPGLATAEAAGDPHGLLAFILTSVCSTSVRGALNQVLRQPILPAGAAALPQPAQSEGGSRHPCPSLFQIPGSQHSSPSSP